ncbi:polysaccharide chain length determinant protein (PEP-CTERM system associated) [Pseudomonas hunanensis]|uniref:Polysaccharide chain length determinant protein (PEP-CTERM system associated) n=1 Tax=Pseudomonas hunanensis TaxID=1247546 RepID=A0ACC6JYT4_9PSED|nr:lipopolysaccharide biosynthesis protein [Pseudomonas hunanensis]MDR6711349.1 polysaccharide chain length determinant protein (PEP-CTERM system associated) [Pseudomonas hunanensis]
MKSEYELSFNDYIAIIKDRAVLLGVTMAVILAVTVAVAVSVPALYQSTGTILVESQQISPELVSANNNSFADERIEVIRQRVMTRENLLRIIDKYSLFTDKGRQFSESEKIDQMRSAIVVNTLSTFVKGRGETTVAFSVSFEHRRPEVAKEVASELVTLFLNENVKQRTERASETTEFLTQEANKLGVELASLENQLADFKQSNGNALPENQGLRMSMLSRAELEFREVDRDYKSAQEELRYLELELSAANAGLGLKADGQRIAAADKPMDLPSLKAEYARLMTKYTAAHPDVVAVKRKIDALEATGGRRVAASSESLDVARVRTKIGAVQSRIVSLAEQKRELVKKMEGYEAEILAAPQVERGLVTLMRDHDNARKKYEEIRAKEMGAKITETLEQENKAERFVLLEPPLMPEKPVKPNRKKIAALGLVLAPVGGGALVMLLEMLNQRVRGVGALESVLGRRVLVAVPFISTQAEMARRKRWRVLMVIAGLLLVAILLVMVHVFYMPLDLLLFKAMARFE